METTPPRYHQGFIQNNRGGSSSSDNGFEFLLKRRRRRRISTSCWWWWWWHTLLRRHDLWIHSVLNPSFLRSFLRLNYNALSLWFVVITRSFLPSIAAIREASKALIWIQIKEPWKWCSCSKKCVRKLINPNLKSSLPQAISRKKTTRGLIYDHQLHDLILEISLKSYTDRKCEERDLQERESLRDL